MVKGLEDTTYRHVADFMIEMTKKHTLTFAKSQMETLEESLENIMSWDSFRTLSVEEKASALHRLIQDKYEGAPINNNELSELGDQYFSREMRQGLLGNPPGNAPGKHTFSKMHFYKIIQGGAKM